MNKGQADGTDSFKRDRKQGDCPVRSVCLPSLMGWGYTLPVITSTTIPGDAVSELRRCNCRPQSGDCKAVYIQVDLT